MSRRGNLKLDESCISEPKFETSNWTSNPMTVGQRNFKVSNFGSEMQDLVQFQVSL